MNEEEISQHTTIASCHLFAAVSSGLPLSRTCNLNSHRLPRSAKNFSVCLVSPSTSSPVCASYHDQILVTGNGASHQGMQASSAHITDAHRQAPKFRQRESLSYAAELLLALVIAAGEANTHFDRRERFPVCLASDWANEACTTWCLLPSPFPSRKPSTSPWQSDIRRPGGYSSTAMYAILARQPSVAVLYLHLTAYGQLACRSIDLEPSRPLTTGQARSWKSCQISARAARPAMYVNID